MNLIKKFRKNGGDGEGGGLVKVRRRDRQPEPAGGKGKEALSRWRGERDEWSNWFDRMWRELSAGLSAAPWSMLDRLPQAGGVEEFGGQWLGQWPALDMAEDEKAVTVRLDVPGMEAKDLDVELSGNVLRIRGSREDEWTDRKHGMLRRERRSGSFERAVTLPSYVEGEKLEARYENGTLTVTVPKQPGRGAKRVKVTGG